MIHVFRRLHFQGQGNISWAAWETEQATHLDSNKRITQTAAQNYADAQREVLSQGSFSNHPIALKVHKRSLFAWRVILQRGTGPCFLFSSLAAAQQKGTVAYFLLEVMQLTSIF